MHLMTARMMAVAITTIACSTPLMADEIWLTDRGPMQWEDTLGDMAVFNLYGDGVAPSELRFFLPELQNDVNGGRGTYFGYWTAETGEVACSAGMVDPMGTTTYDWGILVLSFDRPDFPSSWTAELGTCFDAPFMPMRGVTPNK